MGQCMEAFKHMSIHPAAWNSQPTSLYGEPASSHGGGTTTSPEHGTPSVPSTTKSRLLLPKQLVPVASRNREGSLESQDRGQPASTVRASHKTTRKRGRPSKADMAKRDLKPILPKTLAPRPPPQKEACAAGTRAPTHAREVTQTASPEMTPALARPTSEDAEDTKRRRIATPAS